MPNSNSPSEPEFKLDPLLHIPHGDYWNGVGHDFSSLLLYFIHSLILTTEVSEPTQVQNRAEVVGQEPSYSQKEGSHSFDVVVSVWTFSLLATLTAALEISIIPLLYMHFLDPQSYTIFCAYLLSLQLLEISFLPLASCLLTPVSPSRSMAV